MYIKLWGFTPEKQWKYLLGSFPVRLPKLFSTEQNRIWKGEKFFSGAVVRNCNILSNLSLKQDVIYQQSCCLHSHSKHEVISISFTLFSSRSKAWMTGWIYLKL